MKSWTTIDPKDAADLQLPTADIYGPLSDTGQMCPWPWDPQQLVGPPLGQYHCPYCGSMVVAGLPHPDYAALYSPDCQVGKHPACAGEALDERSDEIVPCNCACHPAPLERRR